jgi:hypothetical protein
LATVAITLVVASPMLLTRSGFAIDFTNYLWTAWAAGRELVHAGHPAYFLNTTGAGIFYPWCAFDGGPLYMGTGLISWLLGGHGEVAFVAVTMFSIAGSYGGVLWLGRQLGLGGWTAHAPALTVVTSAYYTTNLYGRGAWPEFIAVGVIAPLLASALHLARTPAWRPLPILTFVVSIAIFTGSHNITLLWGTAVIAGAALVLWLALGLPGRLPYRRLVAISGLGLTGVLINAWFLFPDIAYEGKLAVHSLPPFDWPYTSEFNTPAVIFNPLRSVPSHSGTPALYAQAPDWFLAWGLAAGVLLLLRRPSARRLRRAWIGAVVIVATLLGMVMSRQFWSVLPYPFVEIQFPFRLGSYIFYAVAGLVLVGALALQRVGAADHPGRAVAGLRLALLVACGTSLGLCLWQEWVPNTLFPNSYRNRGAALASVNVLPRTWYDPGIYHDASEPEVAVPPKRFLYISPSRIHGDRFAAWMRLPPGPQPIQTNIGGGAYMVHIAGVQRLGRNPEGYAVVRRVNNGRGPVYIVIEAPFSLVLGAGWILSTLAIFTTAIILLRSARRRPPRGRPA